MVLIVEFEEVAKNELFDAIEWYEKKQTGLGEQLYGEFTDVLELVKLHPKAFVRFSQNTRKAFLFRFPYYVIYSTEENVLTILAFFHSQQDDEKLKNRVSDS